MRWRRAVSDVCRWFGCKRGRQEEGGDDGGDRMAQRARWQLPCPPDDVIVLDMPSVAATLPSSSSIAAVEVDAIDFEQCRCCLRVGGSSRSTRGIKHSGRRHH